MKTPLVLANRFSLKKLKIKKTKTMTPNTLRFLNNPLPRNTRNVKNDRKPIIPEESKNSMY
tara:strand:- start:70 stop:252 length:183 start_codon:yes stop_codon:yes gene_type:complete